MDSKAFRPSGAESGFTLIEVITVATIISVIMGISIGPLMMQVADSRANSATSVALDTLRNARDRAIGERRNFAVRFIEPNRIEVARQNLPLGSPETIVTKVFLDGNTEFLIVDGVDEDTPDEFGDDDAIAFGPSLTRFFTSEGTFVNSSGDPLNGTLFLGTKGGDPTTARALTILGATALIHTWKWNGRDWID